MKVLGIVLGLLIAAFVCAGMVDTNTYTKETHQVLVESGDTLDAIAGRFYEKDERKLTWNEFRYEVMRTNEKNLHDGCLWVGDLVTVEVSKRAEK